MTQETTVSAAANPALANKLTTEALSLAEQEVASNTPKAVVEPPSDPTVDLLAGVDIPFEGFVNTAEVRELNGADEEAISKIADPAKALMLILERGVTKLGDKPADKEIMDALLAGDRELLLLAIRRLTFGNEISLEGTLCGNCPDSQTIIIDLEKDVPLKKLTNNDDREFDVACKIGTVRVKLPNGFTQKELVNATNKTSAELDTIVLKSCVLSINGNPVLNRSELLKLGIKDRRDILKAISDRNPGPQLSEIKKACSICGQEVPLPLTLADLFQE